MHVLQSILEVGAFRLDLIIYDLSRPRCDSFGVCVQDFSQEKALDRSWLREPTGRNANERIDRSNRRDSWEGAERVNELACSFRGEWAHFLRISFFHLHFFASIPPLLLRSPLAPLSMQIWLKGSLSMHMQSMMQSTHTVRHTCTRTTCTPLGNVSSIPTPSTSTPPPEASWRALSCSQPPTITSDESTMSARPPTGLRERERRKVGKGGEKRREIVSGLGGRQGRVRRSEEKVCKACCVCSGSAESQGTGDTAGFPHRPLTPRASFLSRLQSIESPRAFPRGFPHSSFQSVRAFYVVRISPFRDGALARRASCPRRVRCCYGAAAPALGPAVLLDIYHFSMDLLDSFTLQITPTALL